jgi:hypothetical protein
LDGGLGLCVGWLLLGAGQGPLGGGDRLLPLLQHVLLVGECVL